MKFISRKPAMRALSVALALSMAAAPGAAFAQQGPGPGPQHKPQQQQQRPPQNKAPQQRPQQYKQQRQERPQFRWQDSREVRNYYRQHKMHQYKPLPPGVRFRIGHRRPANVRYYDVPPVLLKRLPPHPGYRYYMAGNDIILVAIATGIIVDILVNVNRY